MNDVALGTAQATTESTAPREATLKAFLDAADQLYDKVEAALARVGLSYPKYEVLVQLQDAGSPLSLSCLADGQSCARSNITQLADKLEAEGLVRRVADSEDRRCIRAVLTSEGAARAVEGKTQLDLVIAEFAASFSRPERLELGRLLGQLE